MCFKSCSLGTWQLYLEAFILGNNFSNVQHQLNLYWKKYYKKKLNGKSFCKHRKASDIKKINETKLNFCCALLLQFLWNVRHVLDIFIWTLSGASNLNLVFFVHFIIYFYLCNFSTKKHEKKLIQFSIFYCDG